MKNRLLTILLLSANLFLIIGCADDQARQQIADTNQRLTQLQQSIGVLDNKVSNQKVLDLLNQVSELQNQINQLNGKVSSLTQGQTADQGNLSQQVQSLDLRVQALESSINGQPAAAPRAITKPTLTPQLQDAVKKIQDNEINAAISELKQIIASNDKASAASARYFLSVAYIANSQYHEAINEANKFIAANRNNKYVPDAMRVIYIAQTQLGNTVAANATAKRLIKSFPNSEAAKKIARQVKS